MSLSDKDTELRDFFQRRLEDESVQPPEAAWEQIRTSLPKRRRKKLAAVFFLSMLAIITGVLTGWFAYQRNATKQVVSQAQKAAPKFITTEPESSKAASASSSSTGINSQQPETIGHKKVTQWQASDKHVQYFNKSKVHFPANATAKEQSSTSIGSRDEPERIIANGNQDQQEIHTRGTTPQSANIADANFIEDQANNRIPYKNVSPPETSHTLLLVDQHFQDSKKAAKTVTPWSVEIMGGFGKNTRSISGTFDGNSLAGKELSDRKVKLKNRLAGIQGGYTFNRYLTLQLGILYGRNSVQSRWFNKLLKDQPDNESYEFSTMEGSLKIASTDLNPYFQNNDSIYVRMRISNRSSYISIPLSLKLSLPAGPIIPYLRAGLSLDLKTSDHTSLQVRNGYGKTKTANFKIFEQQTISTVNVMTAAGLSSNTKWGLNLFGEINYSHGISPYYSKNNFEISSSFVQYKLGLSYRF